MHLPLCENVHMMCEHVHMSVHVHRGHRHWSPLEQNLQTVVNCVT